MKRKPERSEPNSANMAWQNWGLPTPRPSPNPPYCSELTPKQAMAVYEILDDLMDVIWRQYGKDIQRALKHDRTYDAKDFSSPGIDETDVPF